MKRPLGWLALGLFLVCLVVARDLVGTIVFASFMVTTFQPTFRRLAAWIRPKPAALVLTLSITLVILAPLVALGIVLTSRTIDLVNQIVAEWQSGNISEAVGSLFRDKAEVPRLGDLYRELASSAPGFVASLGKVFFALSDVVVKSFLFILLLYGLFARGERAVRWLEGASPFGQKTTRDLMIVYAETGRGILVGVFLVLILHGIVATVGYSIVGIGRAFELGALTAAAGLVPAIGTGLVWVPLAVVLLATRHVGQSIGVTVVGLLVGSVDNLLRPFLSRLGNVPLPTLTLFIAFFGGITTFGPAGLLLGPLLFALTKATIDILMAERRKATELRASAETAE